MLEGLVAVVRVGRATWWLQHHNKQQSRARSIDSQIQTFDIDGLLETL